MMFAEANVSVYSVGKPHRPLFASEETIHVDAALGREADRFLTDMVEESRS